MAVKLLPQLQWKSLSKSLPSEDSQKAESVDGEPEVETGSSGSNDMPSGVVVGILDRPERLYVASFDVSVYISQPHILLSKQGLNYIQPCTGQFFIDMNFGSCL